MNLSDIFADSALTPANLYAAVFHSLEDQIAVIDQAGNILEVNLAWQDFGIENGLPPGYSCTGSNYLKTLADASSAGDSSAGEALQGILEVLDGRLASFSFEYPCHSPQVKRWFIMRISLLHGCESIGLFVVSHHNITQRKLAEQQVEEMAMQDALTGLGNRRAFQIFLNREVRSCSRNRTPIGLLLVDVDCFKDYNDEFGHAAGDQCLDKIGKVLFAYARRPTDLAARIGGDEFAMVLGNAGPETALQFAELILKAINSLNLFFASSRKVTVSIGVLSAIPNEELREDLLFQVADKALYRAKTAGRNQIVQGKFGN